MFADSYTVAPYPMHADYFVVSHPCRLFCSRRNTTFYLLQKPNLLNSTVFKKRSPSTHVHTDASATNWHYTQYIMCTCIICTENYAPFCSMAVRRSFLTVGEQQASAPGPAHYTPTLEDDVKGGGSLKSKVCCTV